MNLKERAKISATVTDKMQELGLLGIYQRVTS